MAIKHKMPFVVRMLIYIIYISRIYKETGYIRVIYSLYTAYLYFEAKYLPKGCG